MEVRRPISLPAQTAGPVLLVRGLRVSPALSQRGLPILQPDGSLWISFYEEWAVSPAEGVTDSLRLWLNASGLFGAVVAPGTRLHADFVMEGQLTTLIAEPSKNTARATLSFLLMDEAGDAAHIRKQAMVSGVAPLNGLEAAQLSTAMLTALSQALTTVETEIQEALRRT